ncbi:MAG: MFS transporter [Actinomycetota bacterium]
MVVAGAAANAASFGILFSFGLFLPPLTEHFDAPTAAVAAVFSGSVLCYYLAGAVGGSLGDRFGAGPVVAVGAVLLPLGLLGASFGHRLWLVAAAYVPLVGLAVGTAYAPLIGAVGRAMPDRRGPAIGVLLTGVGLGTLAFPLLIQALLDRWPWPVVFRILASIALVAIGTAAVTVADPGRRDRAVPSGVVWRSMLVSARFRRLYASVVLVAPGFYAPLVFLNDSAIDRGLTPGRGASLVAAIGLGSLVTRLPFGALAPRIGPRRQYRVSHVGFLSALALWLVADASFAVLLMAALIHGIAWAAWVTAAPLVLVEWFGADDLGLAVGGFYTGLGLGAVIGPPVTGALIDAAGLRPALAALLVTTTASLALTRVAESTG